MNKKENQKYFAANLADTIPFSPALSQAVGGPIQSLLVTKLDQIYARSAFKNGYGGGFIAFYSPSKNEHCNIDNCLSISLGINPRQVSRALDHICIKYTKKEDFEKKLKEGKLFGEKGEEMYYACFLNRNPNTPIFYRNHEKLNSLFGKVNSRNPLIIKEDRKRFSQIEKENSENRFRVSQIEKKTGKSLENSDLDSKNSKNSENRFRVSQIEKKDPHLISINTNTNTPPIIPQEQADAGREGFEKAMQAYYDYMGINENTPRQEKARMRARRELMHIFENDLEAAGKQIYAWVRVSIIRPPQRRPNILKTLHSDYWLDNFVDLLAKLEKKDNVSKDEQNEEKDDFQKMSYSAALAKSKATGIPLPKRFAKFKKDDKI